MPPAGIFCNSGEGEIRTLETLASLPHFECGAFDHSATSPVAEIVAEYDAFAHFKSSQVAGSFFLGERQLLQKSRAASLPLS